MNREDALNDDFFTIQLNIADKIHRLRCKRSEEALARRAARQVNETILKYGGHFNNSELGLKDLLAMVAFHFSMENIKAEDREDTSPVYQKLDELSREIEEYLKS